MLDEYRIEQMGVGAYVDSIDEEVITVDQAVQRAFCWSNEMINNLIYKNGYLVDGYIRYLIMKRNGAKTIRTVYKGQPGALIKGVHINYDGIGTKEYIWRVPRVKGWRKFINNLQIGDAVLCVTKKCVKPVKVTEIQTENIIDGREYSKVLINKKIEIKTK